MGPGLSVHWIEMLVCCRFLPQSCGVCAHVLEVPVIARFLGARITPRLPCGRRRGGRQIPSLAVTLAFVRACHGDCAEWETRWHDTADALAAAAPAAITGADDAASPTSGCGPSRWRTPSGSLAGTEFLTTWWLLFGGIVWSRCSVRRGRASLLLRGGLLPLAHREGRASVVFTPGPHPLQGCAVAWLARWGRSRRRSRRSRRRIRVRWVCSSGSSG
jgi:hypothetical protein